MAGRWLGGGRLPCGPDSSALEDSSLQGQRDFRMLGETMEGGMTSLVWTPRDNLSGMLPVAAAVLSPDSALGKHAGSG